MELSLYTIEGKASGSKVALDDAVFNVEPSDHAIYQDIRLILANQRQGTHKTKERGEVSGSTKKPFRQKGTGGARAGHKRSPLWRHGGTVFGPRPRDYGFKLNRKVKQLARRSALTYKVREKKFTVLENFVWEQPKTQQFAQVLKNFKANDSKVLFVTAEANNVLYLSGRNIPKLQVVHVNQLNTYDIVNAEQIFMIKDAVAVINQSLSSKS